MRAFKPRLNWIGFTPHRKPLGSNPVDLLTKLSAAWPLNEAYSLLRLAKHMSELGIEPRLARLLIEGIKRATVSAAGSCANSVGR